MNRISQFATVLMIFILFVAFLPRRAGAQGFSYAEETKDGRIYVFNNMKIYRDWKESGEMGKSITRIGAGPNGETIVADSIEALQLYYFKHNLPPEVVAETPAPAMQEKLPYKFSGYMFGDYFYNTSRDPNIGNFSNVALPGAEDLNGFQFRRIYFTFDDDISTDFTARFRLEADQAALSSNGRISVFVKDAYLKWKNAFALTDFIFGIQPTPAFEVSESVWAYRSLEKTILDLRGIVSARDIAVSLRGKLDPNGKYNYWIMAGNGSGNNPETDKFKRAYFQFHWKPTEKFQATIYEDYRALPDIPDANNTTTNIGNSSWTTAWFAGYGLKDKYQLGYEGFFVKQDNGTKLGSAAPFTLETRTTIGHSVWGWWNFTPIVGVVGRYDYLEPNNNSAIQGDKRNFFLASLVLKPHKNVWIMPNVQVETYEDSATGQSFKKSVTPRLTLYYIFL